MKNILRKREKKTQTKLLLIIFNNYKTYTNVYINIMTKSILILYYIFLNLISNEYKKYSVK